MKSKISKSMEYQYPNHHYGACPILYDGEWKCSGCGRKAYSTVSYPEGSIKIHIALKQKYEAEKNKWRICEHCQGKGKVIR